MASMLFQLKGLTEIVQEVLCNSKVNEIYIDWVILH